MDEQLLLKIQKLLSLATSSNEHEAKLAAEKANELMIKHNINLSQLNSIAPDQYINEEVVVGKSMPYEAHWVMQVLDAHFFVRCLFKASRKNAWLEKEKKWGTRPAVVWFVGEKTNVQVAHYVFGFLVQKYKQLWKQFQAEHGMPHDSKGSYYRGLTSGLDSQLRRKRQSMEDEMALVIVEDPNLKKKMAEFHPKVKVVQTETYGNDSYAAAHGHMEGKKLKIQRGLESSAGNQGLRLGHKK